MERVSSGRILLAFLAILCGFLGVYSIRQFGSRPPVATMSPQVDKSIVPLASRHLAAGRVVTMGDVALVRLSREEMKQREIKGMFMSDPEQIIGRILNKDVRRGQTFDTRDFFADGTRPGIVRELLPGERAVTISIPARNALIGYAGAGQLVDILFHANGPRPDSGSARRGPYAPEWYRAAKATGYQGNMGRRGDGGYDAGRAITLVESARILALGTNTMKSDLEANQVGDEPIAVTIAITPNQVKTIRVVEGQGEFSLALRHPEDRQSRSDGEVRRFEDVMGIEEHAPMEMEIYRGKQRSHILFQRTENCHRRVDVVSSPLRANLPGSSGSITIQPQPFVGERIPEA